ncbi:MAG: type IV pilus twitching motility protein PilT [Candidatus Eremiobacteraeota bacterium]|nr:type IV pilus twitching motility protein PilT [Candidatus Eremiobacteraeota bacterium]
MVREAIDEVLEVAVKKNASDIHFMAGHSPSIRVNGEIQKLDEIQPLSPERINAMMESLLSEEQVNRFRKSNELDCSYNIPGISRFRANFHQSREGIGMSFRIISSTIPTPEELGLTESMTALASLHNGLVLVTGPTGCGKTTTIACLLELINQQLKGHILTVEDPIEFIFEPKKCIITQREVGIHTQTFANAIKYGMRQDPDVILIGEMRDLETISMALTAAETGHLVFATLHTNDAAKTIDRIVDVFPPYQQQQIRIQLATTLRVVICQVLIPKLDGKGRIASRELLIVNNPVSALIREGKTHQIYNAIEMGLRAGMMPMDRSLANLVRKGEVSMEEAMAKSNNLQQFESYLRV